MITQARLKEILRYDPSTGVFTWRVSKGRAKAGSVAGTFDAGGYRLIMVDGKRYKAHRLAFIYIEGNLPPDKVDHISQNPADNRWRNLRPATQSENMRNATRYTNNTSGFTGVYWHKQRGKWHVTAKIDGKSNYLGLFDCLLDAVAARIRFNRENGFHPNHGNDPQLI